MPWEQINIDEEYEQVNPIPTTTRVDVKLEDIHRMDMPGCPRHRTAGAIQQHSSWTDPDGRHNRFTGVAICAECGAKVSDIHIKSMADSEADPFRTSDFEIKRT